MAPRNPEEEKKKLEALQQLESDAKGIETTGDAIPENVEEHPADEQELDNVVPFKPQVIDGYRILPNDRLPFGGALYPAAWSFAYKCPTSKQIANFSTLNEQDQPAIISAIEELVKTCFVIVDTTNGQAIDTGELNDGERLFFFLLLREFYLHDKPITYTTISQNWQEAVEVELFASRLKYKELSAGLLACFDGRLFTIPNGDAEPITFRVPTFKASGKIFRHIVKVYRDSQTADESESKKMLEDESFNKQFLLVAPFLFVTGNETIDALKTKFRKIQADEALLDGYLTIINKLNLTNLERLGYEYKGSEEETLIRFPGGWKNMFINKSAFGGIFD
jgi:hypothetical protein